MEAVLELQTKEIKFLDDPSVSMIVPVYDLPPMVFKRCLLSLVDQDYQNKEIVIVFDGPNAELQKIGNQFASQHTFVRTIEIEHAGACAARNAGFNVSTGQIVSFFNSDYIAKPGMIRYWVDALQKHPECGFVYGGYQWTDAQYPSYPSKPFNDYELEVENYIDCGFPVWRKYVVEWDSNCKSLQDWDFWMRVVKENKVKGFYLGDYLSFLAEPPRPKGLSYDSSSNWQDRVGYIKKKNGIAQRDLLVTSFGAKNHAVEIAKLLNADFKDHTLYKPSDYKALYLVGFYIRPDEPGLNSHSRLLAHFKDKYPKCKRIVHMIGAGIYWLRKFPHDQLKYLTGALRLSCDHILTETQEAHDELKELGLDSEIVPIPSYNDNWEVKPLPKDFKVSLYLVDKPHTDFDKYCFEHTLSIVRAMPDIQFTAYGPSGSDIRYHNLKHMGMIPRDKWPEYVYDQSMLLRLVRHDTIPMAGCEFIMAGRDVLTNIQMPGATILNTAGKSELNEWDKFSEGLNVYNWPETKTKIVQKIRWMKNHPKAHIIGTHPSGDVLKTYSSAEFLSDQMKNLLDKEKYITKIRELMS